MQRQRIAPNERQVEKAKELLLLVPPLSYDWASPEGREFLEYVTGLADKGIPITWLAENLDIDGHRLYATVTRYRKASIA